MRTRTILQTPVLISAVLCGMVFAAPAAADQRQSAKSTNLTKKAERKPDERATRKASGARDTNAAPGGDAAKRQASASRQRHDAAQKTIDNLK